jgi:hypothetical protein
LKDKINIEKLFSDKLANHESIVSDKLWSGIQSQIAVGASPTAVAAKGISVATKWIIGITSVVAISTTAIVLNYSETKKELVAPNQNNLDSTEIIADNKVASAENNESVVKYEAPISSDVVVATRKTILPKFETQDKFNLESSDNASNTAETLIVKQAVAPKSIELSSFKTDKHNPTCEYTLLTREDVVKLPIQSEVKGSVEAWKNTNIFSPNNDGINDFFFLDCKDLKDFSITIINDKNTVVFASDDPKFRWDGTNYKSGEMVPEGNYGYIVFAVDANNSPVKLFNSLKVSK